MKIKILVFLLSFVFLNSCILNHEKICGEINDEEKQLLDDWNNQFEDSFIIEYDPCVWDWISVKLKTDSIPNDEIIELHHDILNKWGEGIIGLSVYDMNYDFIFHHIYKETDTSFLIVKENWH